mmetsp:Transcript_19342/g.33186  ORF Transcript_19342/g.33186 Transcript_19342/m.33186 type:complete len:463 (+) Transcript_19342:116-1504(+)
MDNAEAAEKRDQDSHVNEAASSSCATSLSHPFVVTCDHAMTRPLDQPALLLAPTDDESIKHPCTSERRHYVNVIVVILALLILLIVQFADKGLHLHQASDNSANNATGISKILPSQRSSTMSANHISYRCKLCHNGTNTLRQYVPSAVIAGVQKGGTSALILALNKIPYIDWGGREPHILNNGPRGNLSIHERNNPKIDQCKIWQAYKKFFEKERTRNASISFIDKTPRYLMKSDVIPYRLMCAIPREMIKIIVVLRDPTDRAYSHYQMIESQRKEGNDAAFLKIDGNGTFEAAVQESFDVLKESGLFHSKTSEEKLQSWGRYTATLAFHGRAASRKKYSFISRGLYILQLQTWLDALSSYVGGIDQLFSNHLLILDHESMKENMQTTVDKVLEFVGLPQFDLPKDLPGKIHNYKPMTNSTRALLQDFYRPYNAALHELLRVHGIEIGFARRAWEEMSDKLN